MKRYILLFLAVVLLVSCKDGVNYIFPSEYRFSKETEIICFPDKITVYNIKGDINIDTLKYYPIIYNDKNGVQKWVDLNMLNDKDLINSIVKSIIENLNKDGVANSDLEMAFNNNTSFYFSGYYVKSKGLVDKKPHFYDDFYLLNIKEKKLYRIKDINKNY